MLTTQQKTEEEKTTTRHLYKELEAPEAVLRMKKPTPYRNSYYKKHNSNKYNLDKHLFNFKYKKKI